MFFLSSSVYLSVQPFLTSPNHCLSGKKEPSIVCSQTCSLGRETSCLRKTLFPVILEVQNTPLEEGPYILLPQTIPQMLQGLENPQWIEESSVLVSGQKQAGYVNLISRKKKIILFTHSSSSWREVVSMVPQRVRGFSGVFLLVMLLVFCFKERKKSHVKKTKS